MMDAALRRYKEAVLAPVAVRMQGVAPLAVTGAGLLLGLAAALAAAVGASPAALVLWMANRVCDGLDGTLARVQGRQTDYGGLLDLVSDFVVYAAIPIGVAVAQPSVGSMLALAFMLACFYVNAGTWLFLAAVLEKRERGAAVSGEVTSVTMPGGLVEGAETIMLYCLILLCPTWCVTLFTITGILVGLTVMGRIRWASRHL